MKAALMYGPNDIRIEEIDRPECPRGGFILKVMAVGLCGSDIRNLITDSANGKYPHIYGHEITGIVDEVSETCTEYHVGDRLYIYPADHCMKCEACRTGHSEMCENLGNNLIRPGGFADYYAVLPRQIQRDARRMVQPFQQAAEIVCPRAVIHVSRQRVIIKRKRRIAHSSEPFFS